jgi:hypothetical protein
VYRYRVDFERMSVALELVLTADNKVAGLRVSQ